MKLTFPNVFERKKRGRRRRKFTLSASYLVYLPRKRIDDGRKGEEEGKGGIRDWTGAAFQMPVMTV